MNACTHRDQGDENDYRNDVFREGDRVIAYGEPALQMRRSFRVDPHGQTKIVYDHNHLRESRRLLFDAYMGRGQ